MKKFCALECGHLVGGGGDRHGKFSCPPHRGDRGGRHERARARQKTAQNATGVDPLGVTRGIAVAGVGGGKAKSHRQKKSLTVTA